MLGVFGSLGFCGFNGNPGIFGIFGSSGFLGFVGSFGVVRLIGFSGSTGSIGLSGSVGRVGFLGSLPYSSFGGCIVVGGLGGNPSNGFGARGGCGLFGPSYFGSLNIFSKNPGGSGNGGFVFLGSNIVGFSGDSGNGGSGVFCNSSFGFSAIYISATIVFNANRCCLGVVEPNSILKWSSVTCMTPAP